MTREAAWIRSQQSDADGASDGPRCCSIAAAARLSGATAAGFAAASRLAARGVLGSATGLQAGEQARLAARIAARVGATARRLSSATAGRLGSAAAARLEHFGATAARLSRTTAARFAAARRLAARVLRGAAGLQAGEQPRLAAARRRTGIATRHFTAAARLVGRSAAARGLSRTAAAAEAEERRGVPSARQRDGDAQRRQQVTFHREAPNSGQEGLGPRPWPSAARIAPHKGGWRRIPCSSRTVRRINAANTLSQWVLSTTQLAPLHLIRQILQPAEVCRSEDAARNGHADRKSRWAAARDGAVHQRLAPGR
jgi:hypothetical protein